MADAANSAGLMTPTFLRVARNTRESADVVSIELPLGPEQRLTPFRPGQFNMLYAFGVGEVPVSMSGDPAEPDRLVHTIRAVGPVSTDSVVNVKPNSGQVVRPRFTRPAARKRSIRKAA